MTILSAMTQQTAETSLAVNLRFEAMLSPLQLSDLTELVTDSCYAKQTGDGAAFLIAFDQDSRYENSVNFDWFKKRFDQFIYVDRIAIDTPMQGKGIARLFYEDLIAFAKTKVAPVLCAEVNIEPPNPASHAFHKGMGFEAIGEASIGEKRVLYYAKKI